MRARILTPTLIVVALFCAVLAIIVYSNISTAATEFVDKQLESTMRIVENGVATYQSSEGSLYDSAYQSIVQGLGVAEGGVLVINESGAIIADSLEVMTGQQVNDQSWYLEVQQNATSSFKASFGKTEVYAYGVLYDGKVFVSYLPYDSVSALFVTPLYVIVLVGIVGLIALGFVIYFIITRLMINPLEAFEDQIDEYVFTNEIDVEPLKRCPELVAMGKQLNEMQRQPHRKAYVPSRAATAKAASSSAQAKPEQSASEAREQTKQAAPVVQIKLDQAAPVVQAKLEQPASEVREQARQATPSAKAKAEQPASVTQEQKKPEAPVTQSHKPQEAPAPRVKQSESAPAPRVQETEGIPAHLTQQSEVAALRAQQAETATPQTQQDKTASTLQSVQEKAALAAQALQTSRAPEFQPKQTEEAAPAPKSTQAAPVERPQVQQPEPTPAPQPKQPDPVATVEKTPTAPVERPQVQQPETAPAPQPKQPDPVATVEKTPAAPVERPQEQQAESIDKPEALQPEPAPAPQPTESTRFELVSLLREIFNQHQQTIASKKLKFSLMVSNDMPEHIVANREGLNMSMSNMLDDALISAIAGSQVSAKASYLDAATLGRDEAAILFEVHYNSKEESILLDVKEGG